MICSKTGTMLGLPACACREPGGWHLGEPRGLREQENKGFLLFWCCLKPAEDGNGVNLGVCEPAGAFNRVSCCVSAVEPRMPTALPVPVSFLAQGSGTELFRAMNAHPSPGGDSSGQEEKSRVGAPASRTAVAAL